ncbi:hypothetical protein DFH27DRAFT_544834 [Peziza echinospora]|nr:hypothetical protein DFH27DRAFT_544834 [Peziza echinospora]
MLKTRANISAQSQTHQTEHPSSQSSARSQNYEAEPLSPKAVPKRKRSFRKSPRKTSKAGTAVTVKNSATRDTKRPRRQDPSGSTGDQSHLFASSEDVRQEAESSTQTAEVVDHSLCKGTNDLEHNLCQSFKKCTITSKPVPSPSIASQISPPRRTAVDFNFQEIAAESADLPDTDPFDLDYPHLENHGSGYTFGYVDFLLDRAPSGVELESYVDKLVFTIFESPVIFTSGECEIQ